VNNFKTITFAKIPPTLYQNEGSSLKMLVKKSSAFLLQAFSQPKMVDGISFEWKSDGRPNTKDRVHERSKEGDDAPLRIGLLQSGPEPFIPFFASSWIKVVRDHMKLPSHEMTYVAVGTKNPPGTTWQSPYSSSIRIIVAEEKSLADGWSKARFVGKKPMAIVGLWIMADGDDTQAEFSTMLRDLTLELTPHQGRP